MGISLCVLISWYLIFWSRRRRVLTVSTIKSINFIRLERRHKIKHLCKFEMGKHFGRTIRDSAEWYIHEEGNKVRRSFLNFSWAVFTRSSDQVTFWRRVVSVLGLRASCSICRSSPWHSFFNTFICIAGSANWWLHNTPRNNPKEYFRKVTT